MNRSLISAVVRYTLLGLVACGAAAATYAVAGNQAGQKTHRASRPDKPAAASAPTARAFALDFVAVTCEYARAHAADTRITRPDCVEASPGHYMCSYAVVRPHRPTECHIMQAKWTPGRASTITVTLAGRTRECGSLREAIRSLR